MDSDLGFVAFLSKSLSEAGYVALPATESRTALPLLEELDNPQVDLLMVNFDLPSTSDLARELRERNQSLRITAIQNLRQSGTPNIRVDASLRKPSPDEWAAESEWLKSVEHVLSEK